MTTFENNDTKISDKLTLQFTAEYNEAGERVCTCGSGIPHAKCTGINGNINFCG